MFTGCKLSFSTNCESPGEILLVVGGETFAVVLVGSVSVWVEPSEEVSAPTGSSVVSRRAFSSARGSTGRPLVSSIASSGASPSELGDSASSDEVDGVGCAAISASSDAAKTLWLGRLD
jgi:hypothetical protein